VNLKTTVFSEKIIICPEIFLYIWKHFGNHHLLATALNKHLFKTGEGLLHACISSNLIIKKLHYRRLEVIPQNFFRFSIPQE
jgi:hypothetical protein